MKDKKVIHIFDLDDTLTKTPSFSEYVGVNDGETINLDSSEYVKDFKRIKAAFADELSKEVGFRRSGDFVVPFNLSNGKHFTSFYMDYFEEPKYSRMFDIKNDVIIVKSFSNFYSDPKSIGIFLNDDVKEIYDSVPYKMILTGRNNILRKEIEDNFKDIGIEYPNEGFFMFKARPNKKKIKRATEEGEEIFIPPYNSIKEYKAWVISESINKNGWDEVHFYEDRQDWLNFAEGVIKSKHPDVKFVPHYISNIKDGLSLSN